MARRILRANSGRCHRAAGVVAEACWDHRRTVRWMRQMRLARRELRANRRGRSRSGESGSLWSSANRGVKYWIRPSRGERRGERRRERSVRWAERRDRTENRMRNRAPGHRRERACDQVRNGVSASGDHRWMTQVELCMRCGADDRGITSRAGNPLRGCGRRGMHRANLRHMRHRQMATAYVGADFTRIRATRHLSVGRRTMQKSRAPD